MYVLLPVLFEKFLGHAPAWYKKVILAFLVINPILLLTLGSFVAGWAILAEFIFTLALTMRCYPLMPGGLLLLEACALNMVSLEAVAKEISFNHPILFLLIFLVTAVTLLKDLLKFLFLKAIVAIRNDLQLGLFFLVLGTVLSALLDALTVMAVVISVLSLLYAVYHRFESKIGQEEHRVDFDGHIAKHRYGELDRFRATLRRLAMLAAIGSMLGGISTLIGEPQNVLIGGIMGWDFNEFFLVMLPISLPVFLVGCLVCLSLERFKYLDFGLGFSEEARRVLIVEEKRLNQSYSGPEKVRLWIQGAGAIFLVAALVLHLTEIYVVGLMLLILVGTFTGASEHDVIDGLKESGGFIFVLAIFFGIVAAVHENHLFSPISHWVLSLDGALQPLALYGVTGLLSAISDNVFVASLFITESKEQFLGGMISHEVYEMLAVAINMGTNIPSIATPNGQAAFLFLLMSPLAGLIRLSYVRMFLLALPFAVVLTVVGATALYFGY